MSRGRNLRPLYRLVLATVVLSGVMQGDVVFVAPVSRSAVFGAETSPESNVPSHIRNLFAALHSEDPRSVEQTYAKLVQMGFSQKQITVGSQLVDPDASVRLQLARSLARLDKSMQTSIIDDLTRDRDESVRAATLQSLQEIGPLPHLQNRILEMSTSDSSPLVRGYARLLKSDWNESTALRQSREQFPIRNRGVTPMPPRNRYTESYTNRQPFGAAANDVAVTGSLFRPQVPYWNDRDRKTAGQSTSPIRSTYEESPESYFPLVPAISLVSGSGPDILRPLDDLPPDRGFGEPEGRLPNDYFSLAQDPGPLFEIDVGVPLGFTGPSGVQPSEYRENSHFIPVEDRWRLGLPSWDRYEKGHPPVDDIPYVEGHWWDPYNQNVIKGDYPIIGQHTFLKITGESLMLHEFRQVPTGTTPFESTRRAGQFRFFGDPAQYFYNHNFKLRVELFHGNASFKPLDWQARVTPVFNINHLDVNELGVVNPDVRRGTQRTRTDVTIEEWFLEAKLADLSPSYDFASLRAGSQYFNSDFRGFIFSDVNRAVRLFGTRFSNRDQFNLIWFDQTEKETNSGLNTFDDRHQNTFIANYFREDFIFPGYTAQASFHYNRDGPSFRFDRNNFLVRPDPTGVFQPHQVESYYFGLAGNGHIGRFNVSNAFYWVTGTDSLNPIASRPVEINAQMGAIELSYDRDWVRFRTSFLWASGDDDPNDDVARGFDSIFDNPNFAGGEFSYWQRQAIRLFGVNLVQRQSIVPDLRSSKTQGQTNFVNPGLWLANAGMDFEVTPKLRFITNANFLWFDSTRSLETFTFQDRIEPEIGTDISVGMEYRPFLNDNVQIIAGSAMLMPGDGFDDLFGKSNFTLGNTSKVDAPNMYSHFLELILIY
ncbi:MAG: HEAT repeat domain-containing protein [Planctomycetaceae bacterium]|nr:HEAT repeat domain-containing protein [Planctomycetaceae bacterium]MBT6487571.1 HEAT repeat domain-containing protein [Planctomycetaceae bacterium]MBT6493229.1 HEAT repeat domain-containing protein [Planctomycetaceae bacterium]